MNRTHTAHPRAIALLMAAVTLPAIPAFAQEAAAPPPVAATVPAPAPAPIAAPAQTPTAQAPVFAPRQEVVQPLPARPAPPAVAEESAPAPRAQAPAPRRAPRATVERAPVERAPVAAAPVAEAPVAAVPVTSPAPTAVAPAAAPVPAPATESIPEVAATETTTTTSIPWLWIGLGILAIAALAALLGRKRNRRVEEVYYDEPQAIAPVAAAPVVAAPIAQPVIAPVPVKPTTVASSTVVADDERPWIGLSIWPKQVDSDGNIQYDLVVENAGDVEAHDVRVSSFLIDGTNSSPMESALIGGSDTRSVDVRAGASVQIAQTMEMTEGVSPRIVAEARYPLPGGGEGHIAARFAIDTATDGTVEARLDDLLERV